MTRGLLSRREIVASGFIYSGKEMVDEDDINASNPDFDQVQIIYGKTEIPMALVRQVLRDIPRVYAISTLLGLPEDETRKLLSNHQKENQNYSRVASEKRKIEKWLSGKVCPKYAKKLTQLAVSFAKSILNSNADNLNTLDTLQAYVSWREQLYLDFLSYLNQISYH